MKSTNKMLHLNWIKTCSLTQRFPMHNTLFCANSQKKQNAFWFCFCFFNNKKNHFFPKKKHIDQQTRFLFSTIFLCTILAFTVCKTNFSVFSSEQKRSEASFFCFKYSNGFKVFIFALKKSKNCQLINDLNLIFFLQDIFTITFELKYKITFFARMHM